MGFEPGMTINDRYELGRQLGAGGMARVYLAHDRVLDREVAVKVLADRYASDPAFVERFRREASAAGGLNHPNIVSVYDRGEADSNYYIVMEYLSGPDLKEVIRSRAPLPPGEAVDYALQVLSALGAAHRRDVIHRDVKPQNVMVAEDGHLKVTDFGIARAGAQTDMTEVGSVIGTAQYLSPEQAQGEEVTAASDCYSLGIVLYELLTGRVPFDGDRAMAVAMKQVNEPPVPPRVYEPEIPPDLDDVVMRALAKRPVDRYRTAEDFRAALFEVRAGLEGGTAATRAFAAAPTAATQALPARPATGPTRVAPIPADEPPSRRRRALPIVLGLIALLVLAGAAFALLTGGADQVQVPPVVNQSQEDALAALEAAGLEGDPRSVTDDAEPGTVIDSDPAAGAEVDEGSTVALTVSGGPDIAQVPNVVGDPLEQAQERLAADGFTSRDSERPDDAEAGTVIAQDPGAGDDAQVNSEVLLVVSSGPELVTVPEVTGGSAADAVAALEAEDLVLGQTIEEENDQVGEGDVFRQSIPPGDEVAVGTAVDITVATAPDEPTIPRVVGFDAGDAQGQLEAEGFRVISEGAFASQPEDIVLEQFPPGGEQAPEGTRVTIVVSLGPEEEEPPPESDPPVEEENGGVPEDGGEEEILPPAPPLPDQGRGPGPGPGGPGRP